MSDTFSTQSSLEIYLLGRFCVKADGVVIEEKQWELRSAKLLIKLLALKPAHSLHREQITDLLWTELEPETALNKLNKAIHSARRALEPQTRKGKESHFVLSQKQQVMLDSPNGVFIDVEEFERLAATAIKNADVDAGEAALKLYKGDLLTEDMYEEWLTVKRESLRLLYRKAAAKTASLHAENGDYQRSIGLLKKLASEDPTDEHVQQRLMRLLAVTGSKYQALKQFELCLSALRDLGVEPEPETLELVENIKAGKIHREKVKPALATTEAAAPSAQAQAPPAVRQLTFQQGGIQAAKFIADGEKIAYSAAWNGDDYEIYTIDRQEMDSTGTGLKKTGLFAVSAEKELALALNRKFLRGYTSTATLARQDSTGGDPRPLLENVQWADWFTCKKCLSAASEIECLAIVRDLGGKNRLEFPIGNVLYETGGWISHPKFSPDGKWIAFVDHESLADDSGRVSIVNLNGEKKTLTGVWISIQGLAWNKQSQEIWFTAAIEGNARKIYAVNLSGNERLIYQGIGSLTLQDLSESNSALVTVEKTRIRILAKSADADKERDLSWHDWSLVRDLSAEGKTILLTEAGESGGSVYTSYVRRIDGSPALSIGRGSALALSPDGKYALVRLLTSPQQLALISIGAGETMPLKAAGSNSFFYQPWACFFPDGKRILFAANEPDNGTRLYVQNIRGNNENQENPFCITPEEEGVEMSSPHSISPDGKYAAIVNSQNSVCLYSLEDYSCKSLKNLETGFLPVGWSGDGKYLFVRTRGEVPAIVSRYEPASGLIEKWLELMPKDSTGVTEILRVLLTPDGKSFAYSYTRELSDLYLIEGLK